MNWIKSSTGSLPPQNEEVWCIVKISDHDWSINQGICRRLITVGTFSPESGWWFRNAFLKPLNFSSPNASIRETSLCEYWSSIDSSSRLILDKTKWADE